MQRLSARPHHVGSPYDKQNAEWILSQFKSWGLDAQIEQFDVLFPTPKERVLELTEPTRYTAKLQEPPVPGDPTSNQQSEQLPTYNAYSRDGDVTAPLVYVNYGRPEDYDELTRRAFGEPCHPTLPNFWPNEPPATSTSRSGFCARAMLSESKRALGCGERITAIGRCSCSTTTSMPR